MHELHHIKSFKCTKIEFSVIETISKKHRNIVKVQIALIKINRMVPYFYDKSLKYNSIS